MAVLSYVSRLRSPSQNYPDKNETHLIKLVEEHGRTDAPEAKEGGRDRCNSRFSRMANSPGNRFSNRVIGIINDVSHSTSAVAIRDTGIA